MRSPTDSTGQNELNVGDLVRFRGVVYEIAELIPPPEMWPYTMTFTRKPPINEIPTETSVDWLATGLAVQVYKDKADGSLRSTPPSELAKKYGVDVTEIERACRELYRQGLLFWSADHDGIY